MKTVSIGSVTVGAGLPKIAAPIVGQSADDILRSARIVAAAPCDIAEWRADFYDEVFDRGALLRMLAALRDTLGDKPLLFTFRTAKEGGAREVSPAAYTALTAAAAESGCADAVDLEVCTGDDLVRGCIGAAHRAGVAVIGSCHDFRATPPKDTLIAWLRKAQEMGADIAKIAVMPQSPADVLTLLQATEEMTRLYADRPIAAMSMSPLGAISRLCGETFGSALTFGIADQSSAPGQLPVAELRAVLELLHRAAEQPPRFMHTK